MTLIVLLKSAWDDLPQSVLKKSWSKISNWDDDQFNDDDDLPISELFLRDEIYASLMTETQQLLTKIGMGSTVSTDEIEEWNADEIDANDDDIEDNDIDMGSDVESERECSRISYNDAINAVNTLIKWNENNVKYSNKHIANLIELREDIVKDQLIKPQKQTTINNFFSRSNA